MIRTFLALVLVLGVFTLAPTAAPAQATPDQFDCNVDQQEKLVRYSLYFEDFRMENYEAARPNLEWLLACAPGFAGNAEDDRNFRRAVDLYERLAEQASDPAEARAHLERARELLTTAVSTLQDAGAEVDPHYWTLRHGRFLQTHESVFANGQNLACELYEEAYAMRPADTQDFYLQVIAFCRTEAALEDNSADAKRDTRTFLEGELLASADEAATREYIQTQAERLITTPREQFDFLYQQYRDGGVAALSDSDLEQLFTLNQQAGSQLLTAEESRALRRALLPRIAELNPTFGRISALAAAALEDGDEARAVAHYERALELAEDRNQRRDAFYNIAVIRERQGQRASAANFLREALALDGNHGASLYLMGSMIQASVRGNDVQARAAYWCAADFFNRAASAGTANARAAAAGALRGAPASDEYFFLGWRPGQTVSANYGWGSCTATVR
jgi:tetratricopeptide (TPR) repeat protein